jgi:hypothetical protein
MNSNNSIIAEVTAIYLPDMGLNSDESIIGFTAGYYLKNKKRRDLYECGYGANKGVAWITGNNKSGSVTSLEYTFSSPDLCGQSFVFGRWDGTDSYSAYTENLTRAMQKHYEIQPGSFEWSGDWAHEYASDPEHWPHPTCYLYVRASGRRIKKAYHCNRIHTNGTHVNGASAGVFNNDHPSACAVRKPYFEFVPNYEIVTNVVSGVTTTHHLSEHTNFIYDDDDFYVPNATYVFLFASKPLTQAEIDAHHTGLNLANPDGPITPSQTDLEASVRSAVASATAKEQFRQEKINEMLAERHTRESEFALSQEKINHSNNTIRNVVISLVVIIVAGLIIGAIVAVVVFFVMKKRRKREVM